jgi:hypothetical protein
VYVCASWWWCRCGCARGWVRGCAGRYEDGAVDCAPWCLYNVAEDVSESTDLAGDPQYKGIVDKLVRALNAVVVVVVVVVVMGWSAQCASHEQTKNTRASHHQCRYPRTGRDALAVDGR